jgi:starch synthase (maltosyl-transferring)
VTASDAAATTTSLDQASNGTEPAPDTTDPDLAGPESVGTAPSPEATTTPMHLLLETLPDGVLPFGRIPVQNVQPLVDGGTRPAKSVEHE